MTTRVIPIQPADGERPEGVSPPSLTPKTIQLKRSTTTRISLADIAPAGKGDTAPLEEVPTTGHETIPKSSTNPMEGIQPRPATRRKSETIRISLTDVMASPQKPADGKRMTTSIPVSDLTTIAAVPPTIQLKRPPTVPITIHPDLNAPAAPAKVKTSPMEAPTAMHSATGGDKKGRTTRLILDATAAAAAPADSTKRVTSPITVIPQTIRLKRPSTGFVATPSQLKVHTDAIGEAPTVIRTPDLPQAMTTTSRILVEESTPTSQPAGETKRTTTPITTVPTPHTIRLKRPSSAGLDQDLTGKADSESSTLQKAKKAETAKIDLPAEAGQIPITQRKTIKIKRTERNVAPRTVILKQPGSVAAPAAISAEAAEQELIPATEEQSPVFFAVAAAAVVLAAGLVYILAAQAFGPELVLPIPASLL
ncbi:MAG: hypothetical protein KKG09_08775 [Verrucomicrobia bacterium]|nr:hypothetical protein [Verrucomicrobiota bacterium]MBU4246951.1 hypothetical protein [Verrucomicrobiota bacterium]MBU4291341.1 hypothetical protein [Verrucomicrobiota bacterium]MBU4498082.1 hypothetical protein [Verrucomicrobiota bacterium]MCG2680043.1 hypothetical protein [Kiritimatiellia bacterium]